MGFCVGFGKKTREIKWEQTLSEFTFDSIEAEKITQWNAYSFTSS